MDDPGMATALVSAALIHAQEEGMSLATAQASGSGEPVYRRMGLESVSKVHALPAPATSPAAAGRPSS